MVCPSYPSVGFQMLGILPACQRFHPSCACGLAMLPPPLPHLQPKMRTHADYKKEYESTRQLKAETAEYRVVFQPKVAIRREPWGAHVAYKDSGEVIRTNVRSTGAPSGDWVRLLEKFDGGEGWMLIDGTKLGLGKLLERVDRASQKKGRVQRYKIVCERSDIIHVREKPNGPSISTRKTGRVLRTDLELNGWVRLQEDFYKVGNPEPLEGWAMVDGRHIQQGMLLERWEPPTAAGALIGASAEQGVHTSRYWIIAPGGIVVRERPWGRVLTSKRRGGLLRVDLHRDGWVRVEEDFVESGPLNAADPEEVNESAMLEGWVLLDGRDLGLLRQLQLRAGEPEPPKLEEGKEEGELAARRAAKHKAHGEQGQDWSLGKVLKDNKVSDDVGDQLAAAGVHDLEG